MPHTEEVKNILFLNTFSPPHIRTKTVTSWKKKPQTKKNFDTFQMNQIGKGKKQRKKKEKEIQREKKQKQ